MRVVYLVKENERKRTPTTKIDGFIKKIYI